MKQLLAALAFLLTSGITAAQPGNTEAELRRQADAFVDQWHKDAANADPAYFDKMAVRGVYIGTDKSEIWTRDQFKTWAQPFFDRKKAWAFTAIKRNVYFSADKEYIWFDEQLNTPMGICQASGVIHRTGRGFEIEHYQLSLAVPNPLMDQFTKAVKEFEARQ
ncbi:nuclear transport factor 2 family protein [Pseudoduganella sp. LjRoot289]|uniref:nuclear transport factor 2 family protein n=1 Tax=Pseudoduganella sp. LjRoot289 TaxID=3342314 RepID=UPI003ECF4164